MTDEIDETLPEVVKSFLRKGAKLQNINLDINGRWTHEGLDFENPKIIRLFSASVGRTEGGTWVLEIPPFTYPITVERTGFFVERVRVEDYSLIGELSDGTSENIDISTIYYEPEGQLYCKIKGGEFEARFKKQAYYALEPYFIEASDGIALKVGDVTQTLITD